jgi:carbon monoxide dehydrogenase subunit G
MEPIREAIEIRAPVERVWAVVHGDIANVPRWSQNLVSAEVVGGGPLGAGSELRYVVRLPIGRTADVRLQVQRYDEYRACSGTFSASGMRGTWGWTYRTRRDCTVVAYQTDVKVGGVLRLAARAVEGQVTGDVRRNLDALRAYVESGKGPRAR